MSTPLPFTLSDFPVALWVLLGAILFFEVLGLFHRLVLGGRLRRIEKALSSAKSKPERSRRRSVSTQEPADQVAESEQNRLFDEFLQEDPQRQLLSKKEQFDGFRKWRKEKGLNWSK